MLAFGAGDSGSNPLGATLLAVARDYSESRLTAKGRREDFVPAYHPSRPRQPWQRTQSRPLLGSSRVPPKLKTAGLRLIRSGGKPAVVERSQVASPMHSPPHCP